MKRFSITNYFSSVSVKYLLILNWVHLMFWSFWQLIHCDPWVRVIFASIPASLWLYCILIVQFFSFQFALLIFQRSQKTAIHFKLMIIEKLWSLSQDIWALKIYQNDIKLCWALENVFIGNSYIRYLLLICIHPLFVFEFAYI